MTERRALSAPTMAAPLAPNAYPAVVAALAGLSMVVGAWVAVAGQPAFARQVGWLNVAVGGLVVVAGGAAAYLVEFRRQLRRRIVRITSGSTR